MAGKQPPPWLWGCLCLAVALVLAGGKAPLVNEVHYLTKARHFWDLSWCHDDIFLQSADTHRGFYLTCGWLTSLTSLAVSAYCLRWVSWVVLVSGWCRLGRRLGLDGLSSFLAWTATLWLIRHAHLAGEWLIAGAEGKPFAYGCVLWALSYLAEQRWPATWLALGLAIWFHPVVGGWCTLGVIAVALWERQTLPKRTECRPDVPEVPTSDRRWSHTLLGAAMAGLLAGVAIWPVIQAEFPVDRATATEAAVIQVYHRLPHHLVIHAMRPWHHWRFAAAVVVWLAAAWCFRRDPAQRRLQQFVGWTVLLTLLGCLIDVATWHLPSLGAPLLKYYWHRLGDIFVPVGIACRLAGWLQNAEPRGKRWGSAMLLLGLVGWVSVDFVVQRRDPRPTADRQGSFGLVGDDADRQRRYEDWRELCRWAKMHTRYYALFLTPTRSQTFKWYAQRAEFATWKDCPQDAAHLVAWWRRLEAIRRLNLYRDGPRPSDVSLQQLAAEHGIQYVVVLRERDVGRRTLSHRFRNNTFDVYRLSD